MSSFLTSALLLISTLSSTTAQFSTTPPPIQTQPYGNLTGSSNISTPACPSQGGCHILVARGSLEPPGYGSIGAIKDQILARVPGSTFHVGNATTNGLYPRTNNANFYATGLAGRVKSYCDEGDPFCASGKELQVHLGTIARYEAQAVEFVVGMVESFNRRSGNVNGSSGGNSTTTTPEPYTGMGSRRWEVDAALALVVMFVVLVLV